MAHGNGGARHLRTGFFVGALQRHAAGGRLMVQFAASLWLAFGAVFILVAATQPGSNLFFKLPQWILLIPVGLLALA